MVKKYLGDFENFQDVCNNFNEKGHEVNINEEDIIIASYDCPPYEGSAFVLFKRDGKYYEVNGSHCSCYGLEGQWQPEEVHLDSLYQRAKFGYISGMGEYQNKLVEVLDTL